MESYVPPSGQQLPGQYGPGQYGPGMGGPPSYFDYGNPGPSRPIPPSYDYQPPASEIGKPINLVNSGVVHDLDSSGRPKQEHGNNKTIMVFGLFGVVVFIVAAIAGAVYSKKKGVAGRRGSQQQRLESHL